MNHEDETVEVQSVNPKEVATELLILKVVSEQMLHITARMIPLIRSDTFGDANNIFKSMRSALQTILINNLADFGYITRSDADEMIKRVYERTY